MNVLVTGGDQRTLPTIDAPSAALARGCLADVGEQRLDSDLKHRLAGLHRALTLQRPRGRPRGAAAAGGWKPGLKGIRMESLHRAAVGWAARVGNRMSFMPGWNSIEGSARWGDIFFWTGFACLVLLAGSIVLSKLYGWRKDALVTVRDQLAAIAADARIEQQRREIEVERARAQPQEQREQERHDVEPIVTHAVPPAAPAERAPVPVEKAAEPRSAPPPQREPERIARLPERSPRGLTEGQKKSMVSLLSAYRGQRFTVVCIAGDAEGKSLADAIVTVLRSAGWEFPENAVAEAAYGGGNEPLGVSVIVNAGQMVTPSVLKPTSNLVKALADAGLMHRDGALADPTVPRDRIEIRVGRNRAPS
jgi:hypothetical protein